jgi:hypothetical protein
MIWRDLLLDGPTWIAEQTPRGLAWLWRAYWILVAAATILCFTSVIILLVLTLVFQIPVPLPPPVALPVLPAAGPTGGRADATAPQHWPLPAD